MTSYNGIEVIKPSEPITAEPLIELTNTSTITLAEGHVVIVDTTKPLSVTTTTTAGHRNVAGVVAVGGPPGAKVKLRTTGITPVKVAAATAIGNWLQTSKTAGLAAPTTSAVVGNFAIALTAGAAGETVQALFLRAETL